jgi:hypothetical protein
MIAAAAFCLVSSACAGTPSSPSALPDGRWSGDGACLTVAQECDFVAGCGHGRFPPPVVDRTGAFTVEGTYRIEAGPIGIEPAPPATFAGVLAGDTLTLIVTPRDPAQRRAVYTLRLTNAGGRCSVPCV